MIEIIVKIAGSIFCLGAGTVLFAFGLIIISVFILEVWNKINE
jgi:hypothetical protein